VSLHELKTINRDWYVDINHFARHTAGLHGFMELYAYLGGIGLLALCLLGAWWRARSDRNAARAVAWVLWAAGGTVVAWIFTHYGLKPLVAEPRPYFTIPHVEVLLHETHGYSFPSGHATVAGGVMTGLWMARRKIAALLATVLGLFLCFGRVYTGMHYPGDVIVGLVVGAVVLIVLAKPAVAILEAFDRALLHTPLAGLVATADRGRTAGRSRAHWAPSN